MKREKQNQETKSLSSKDADKSGINSDDQYGDSPLHYAVQRSNYKAAEILLQNGANPDDTDDQGITPLALAARIEDDDRKMNVQMLKLLCGEPYNAKEHFQKHRSTIA